MPDYTWNEVQYLPAPPPGLGAQPAWTVAANMDGHLEVFAIGADQSIWHVWQLGPNSPYWSSWDSFGAPTGATLSAIGMIALQNQDGRLELFVQDANYDVWHIWQAAANANWDTNWSSLGRPIVAGAENDEYITQAFLDDGGCLQLVSQNLGTDDGEIFSRGQVAANGNWANDWVSLGSPPVQFNVFAISPLDRTVFNRVYVSAETLGEGAAAPVLQSEKSSFLVGAGQWSGWKTLDWTTPQGPLALSLSLAARNQDKHIELFAFDTNAGDLWHTWQTPDGDTWSGSWANLGHAANTTTNSFDVALDQQSRLTVASWQNDGFIYVIGQTTMNNGWGSWYRVQTYNLSGFFASEIKLVSQQSGLLTIFTRILDNQLIYIPQILLSS